MTPLVVAQITDCHLQNDPRQDYRGQNVEQHLDRVVESLLLQSPLADLILWTGDLVHHGGPEGYQRLSQRLADLPVPSYWIPGNHDDVALMQQVGHQDSNQTDNPTVRQLNQRSLVTGGWGIILLDSTSEPDGQGGGSLAQCELDFLQQQLQNFQDYHCLVVLHHNPLPVGSDWQDQIMLGNADLFWRVLGQHSHVRAVINGHVHQPSDRMHNGVRVMMTPATSVQFKAACPQLVLEDDPDLRGPAYRLLALYPDGRIETSVKRVAG
ncbi:metallophosphoesterase [uncultured Amphritea sp.]|uniref:metallophosphoesterase n=1 Tax=uncultured Amphritea sp. TaxID=981605 RepID=UPI002622AC10|nr:metallophosphoesterase [uncultured Amphritea sp.]